ncbi:MAG: hypothetical protein LBS21_04500 [Clostridiales bacterium]|jgi:hypothetical protein|nr:hypothetical protein [Clostridiales bacterium]
MKWPAEAILLIILVGSFIQPLAELGNVLKERLILNSAISNSSRAAYNNAVNIWHMGDLDAQINPEEFMECFSEAFCESLNLSQKSMDISGTSAVFSSNNGRFNDISVSFDLLHTTYDALNDDDLGETIYHDRYVTLITAQMETTYLFRTYWLKMANGASNDGYKLTANRKFIMQIIN